MTKMMNVAMIGGGFMAKAHAMAYASMPMFFWPAPAIPHRKVVVDVTDGTAEEARLRFGFEESSSDWRAVVNRPDIDVVDICTPNNVHAEIAIEAARAGKHIICEKPLARTVEEARAMAEAAREEEEVSPIEVAAAPKKKPDVDELAERLAKLDELFDKGLISEAEHSRRREQILDEI